jgi:hypothetical protein
MSMLLVSDQYRRTRFLSAENVRPTGFEKPARRKFGTIFRKMDVDGLVVRAVIVPNIRIVSSYFSHKKLRLYLRTSKFDIHQVGILVVFVLEVLQLQQITYDR